MKIIKHGKRVRINVFICTECGCVFEEISDNCEHYYSANGIKMVYNYCPECHDVVEMEDCE